MKTLTLFLFSYSVWAVSAVDCPRVYRSLLLPVFVENYERRESYQCSNCFFNSGELAREIQNRFGPAVNMDKVRILIFKHRDVDSISKSDDRYEMDQYLIGMKVRNREHAVWKYHAVLEYEGQILDLDLKDKTILPFHRYVKEMFPPVVVGELINEKKGAVTDQTYNQPNTISIAAVPVKEYFRRFAKRPDDQQKQNLDFVLSFPYLNITEFAIDTARKERSRP